MPLSIWPSASFCFSPARLRTQSPQAYLVQFRLDGKDLDALTLEPGRVVARFHRDGIGQRLPVGQVMEKQRCFMGKINHTLPKRNDTGKDGAIGK